MQCSQIFAHIEKRKNKVSFNSRCQFCTARESLPAGHTGQFIYANLSCAWVEWPCLLHPRTEITVGLGRCHMMPMLQQSQRAFTEPETERYSPQKVIQIMWALSLLVKKCSRPEAHSYAAEWASKDCSLNTSFPNIIKS